MPLKYFLSFLFACFCFQNTSWAQFSDKPPTKDKLENDSSRIDIINIDKFKERNSSQGLFRDLTGNVHLKQKEMHIWCDTGFILPNQQVEAFSNVQMLQDDSIRIFSDSLYYDGIQRFSKLRKNVVLKDTSMTLFADKLNYDLTTRIATFPDGSLIESDTTTLISKKGTYNTNTNIAHFSDSVRITNPNYKLTADSLAFNTQTEMAYFLGPTKVYNDEKVVYCEDGFYDSQKNYAELYKNARFENREDGKLEVAEGDTIIYDGKEDMYYLIGNAYFQNDDQEVFADTILMDGKTEQYTFRGNPTFKSRDTTSNQSIVANNSDYNAINKTMIFRGDVRVAQDNQIITTDSLDYNAETKSGLAKGNVVWQDTSAKLKITCGQAFYNDSTKYLLAHLDPILTTLIDNDTMWLRADTLISLPDSTDTEQRHLYAFHNVRTFKSNIQSLCDSLYYDAIDSTFYFYQDPILWVDGTQFTADTIHVEMKSSKIHQVRLFEKSLIVNTKEATFFNQIKGKNAIIQFKDGAVKTMNLKENGETVYYATDARGAYMLVNDIDCSSMILYFTDKQIKRIRYEGKPKAVVYPMHQVDHKTLQLTGFKWLDSIQIKSKYDFLDIPEPIIIDRIDIDSMSLDSSTIVDSLSMTSNSLAVEKIDSTISTRSDSMSSTSSSQKKGSSPPIQNKNSSTKSKNRKKKKNPKRKIKKKKLDSKNSKINEG